MELDTVLGGNTGFVGWNVYCRGQGYSAADCETAAVFIASSFENNVSASGAAALRFPVAGMKQLLHT